MKASENWFSHDANKGFTPEKPEPNCKTESARQALEKSRGNEMNSILKGRYLADFEFLAYISFIVAFIASECIERY